MRRQDPKTSGEFSGLELPLLEESGNGHVLTDHEAEQEDFRELTGQGQTIARLRVLWEHRRTLGRVTGAGLLLFALIALLIPKRYQSIARLMPPDNEAGSGLALAAAALSGGGSGLGSMASDLLGQKSTSDLIVGVLRSTTVEDSLIQQFDLRKTFGNHPMEDLRKALEGRTDISIDRKSQIITIAVTDKRPQRAAAMAEAYVEQLNRTLAAVSTSSARRERIFLEGRLRTVNQDLEASEKAFSQFASKNAAIDIKEQGKAMVTAAATLEGQLIAARSELEGVRQIYADNNVRVRSLQARITELESQLAKVGGESDGASGATGIDVDSLYPSIRKLPLLGVPYADLYRKTRVQEALFETLTQKYELAKVQEAKETPAVKVLDPPSLPEKKSFPPRTLIVLLGGALAFSGGVIWIFTRRRWEETDPADPAKALATEVLNTVKSAMPWASRNGHGLHTGVRLPGEAIDPKNDKIGPNR